MKKILVVEDDEPFVKIINLALRGLDCKIDVQSEGKAALKKVMDNKYDMVISDFRLPNAHGLDIIRLAQEVNPDCKSILISAASEEMIGSELNSYNLYGFLKKPLAPLQIRELVVKAF